MKTTKLLTSVFVLGSIALGTLGQAKEAAAITFTDPTDPNGQTIEAKDPEKELLRGWLAEEAVSDGVYHDPDKIHNHAFWLPGLIGGDEEVLFGTFVWDGPAFFYEYEDGTANLFGSIYALRDDNKKFDVNVWFEGKKEESGSNGPKKELNGSAYSNGGPVDTDDWYYYDVVQEMSTLTGVSGEYAGKELNLFDVTNGGYTTQVGIGANGKNINMGLATWFGDHENFTYADSDYDHSDINIDLVALEAEEGGSGILGESIPEPATMSLLSLGLLGSGLGVLKRKNK
ncbi:MAG: PEP-CTERM sorting domain-containing protein [Okeania sp. SIO2C9]|uniref:PEP-CTERM sorting domain-containing protein n=1 Tax=Okeania sp. SIO2C9 TaxID=2607791 RepID=UPI0013C1AE37|nr:PEP-CTERM sorting domain-containing protein [Okeania sp. SIO2C9]NEQ75620.1 PEP-CTERM sorting domain-containing protein [Okeania sp. SIO2C9]